FTGRLLEGRVAARRLVVAADAGVRTGRPSTEDRLCRVVLAPVHVVLGEPGGVLLGLVGAAVAGNAVGRTDRARAGVGRRVRVGLTAEHSVGRHARPGWHTRAGRTGDAGGAAGVHRAAGGEAETQCQATTTGEQHAVGDVDPAVMRLAGIVDADERAGPDESDTGSIVGRRPALGV